MADVRRGNRILKKSLNELTSVLTCNITPPIERAMNRFAGLGETSASRMSPKANASPGSDLDHCSTGRLLRKQFDRSLRGEFESLLRYLHPPHGAGPPVKMY